MTDINGLLRLPDFGTIAMQGFEAGRAARREDQQQSALSAYAQNPSEQTMNALLPFMPANQAFQVVQQRQQAHVQRQQTQDEHLKKSVGQAVLDVMRRPADQRGMMWDAYVDQFARTNPNAEQYRGRYSEQGAMAVLAEQGLMEEYQKSVTPPKTALQQNYEFLNGVSPQYGKQYIERQVSEPPMIANNGDGTFMVIPRSVGKPSAAASPPASAVDYLRKNPGLKGLFEAKYGAGSAAQYFGGPTQPASGGFPGN
jgi:hypothetical protein